ncbi:hypothetical protein GJ496_010388 [Pomphorhynchus laevis]|nr:hypothetical protein GJ496_010388 [Pomphorhynchus laevis]
MAMLNILEDFAIRVDGRQSIDLRKITCKLNCVPTSTGSALFQQGSTIVRAAVYGPRQITNPYLIDSSQTKLSSNANEMIVECHFYNALNQHSSNQENSCVASLIKQSVEAVLLPFGSQRNTRSVLQIDVELLSSDGSSLAVAINATSMALVNAGLPLKDLMCASSAARLRNVVIVDTNRFEESFKPKLITAVVCPKLKEIANVHTTDNLHTSDYEILLKSALEACDGILCVLEEVIMQHSSLQLTNRSAGVSIEDTVFA